MNIQNRAIIIGIREPLVGQRLQIPSAAPKVAADLHQGKPPVPKDKPDTAAVHLTLPARTEVKAWLATRNYGKNPNP